MRKLFISASLTLLPFIFTNTLTAKTHVLELEENIIDIRSTWLEDIKNNVINSTPKEGSAVAEQDRLISREYTSITGERKKLALADKSQDSGYLFNSYQTILFGEHDINIRDHKQYQEINLLHNTSTRAYDEKKQRTRSIDFILKDHFKRGRPYQVLDDDGHYIAEYSKIQGSSYPSGHTWNGFKQAAVLAMIFPEKGSEMFNRAIEYGESRVIVGAHFATDTIASRVGNYYLLSQLLSDEKNTKFIVESAKNIRKDISSSCPNNQKNCLTVSSPITNEHIGYYGKENTQNTANIEPKNIPKTASYLLRLRFPYLNNKQWNNILASTAYPSHSIAGWNIKENDPNTYWGLINLPAAYQGPAYLYENLVVNQETNDLDIANFGELDEWKNNIQGVGKLIKNGHGTLVLSGNNTFAGLTVNQGHLVLAGENKYLQKSHINGGKVTLKKNLDSAIDINKGTLDLEGGQVGAPVNIHHQGLLTGNGSIQQLTANQGAAVAPGHSIGTINIVDSITFAPDSHYLVEITPEGNNDKIISQGSASLKGGIVTVSFENQNEPLSKLDINRLFGTQYTILSAQKGVNGQFDTVLPNYQFIGTTLNYAPKEVTLKIGRNNTPFSSAATTPNQKAAANAIDRLPISHPLYEQTLKSRSKQEAQTLFSDVTGQIYADVLSNQLNDSRQIKEAVLQQARLSESLNSEDKGNVWVNMLYDWDKTTGDSNATGYKSSSYGLLLGANRRFINDKMTFGIAAGFSQSSLSNHLDQGHSNNYHAAIYGSAVWQPIAVRSGLSHTSHLVHTERAISDGTSHSANYYTNTHQAFIEMAYPINTRWMNLEPFTNFTYINTTNYAINEHINNTSLQAGKQHIGSRLSTIGLRLDNQWKVGNESNIGLHGELNWQYQYGSLNRGVKLNFSDTTSAFTIHSAPAARHGVALKVGTNINIKENTKLSINYNKFLSGHYHDNNIDAKVAIAF
ncbi:autotransporter domain-containing protein [Providencia vermicola]|uniref:autotransporter domain-containing protein n=1 Tax=Providencia vermicola TaxID=333965 RepID=UPI0032DA7A9C